MIRSLTLGDVSSASWQGAAGGRMSGHVYCRNQRCRNKYVFDVQHQPPLHSWPRPTDYDERSKLADEEYSTQPVPDGWVVVFTDHPNLYCSARCARVALQRLERELS